MIDHIMNLNCDEIDSLLEEIHKYLKRRKPGSAKLSPKDRKLAEELIGRSKRHLQQMITIANREETYDAIGETNSGELHNTKSPSETESYVDMSKNNDIPPALPEKNPALVTQPRAKFLPTAPEPTSCPYKELPAKHVSPDAKNGSLSLRRKMFSIFDRSSTVFGAIHENWLLVYHSVKDTKPFRALDLKEYEAKEDCYDTFTNDGSKEFKRNKAASSFTVFSTNYEDKSYYSFVAATYKDMTQWVTKINKSHDQAMSAGKNSHNSDYEIVDDPNISDDNKGENIYNEIDSVNSQVVINDRPPPNLPLKSTTEVEEIVEECDMYQEVSCAGAKLDLKSERSFDSEPDADQTYDELATIQDEVEELKSQSNIGKIEEENIETTLVDPAPKWSTPVKNTRKDTIANERSPTSSLHNSIVQIRRQNCSPPQTRGMETFSRNSKLETFQANSIKESLQCDFHFMEPSMNEPFAITSIETQQGSKKKKKQGENEKPMVLLKDNIMEEETSSKKLKKSPVIPVKPAMNKVVKKLNL
ncbi:uncharacterized protein [Euwallacea fornicatus]|uniref:uncharacterized protein n=1 Tax=Euwallacea fornicatus TaxID=995702 RepID=UPI00338EA6A5